MKGEMNNIELYTYCKSSAAYRVRIALNLKNISYESKFVSLVKDGGENYKQEYLNVNPQAMIPSLKINDEVLTQSTAIIEWLEENYSTPALLPQTSIQRAQARALSQIIACDIHPLNNLRVLDYIKHYFQSSEVATYEQAKQTWYRHWISEGFKAIEVMLASNVETGAFCIDNTPSIADVYLIPQVYNALRFNCEVNDFPTIMGIYQHCVELDAFYRAAPEQQDDYIE
jgi:maleylacetoacetate isomerase